MEAEAQPLAAAVGRPVLVLVDDDLGRGRLTTFFRLLLVIPHYIWYILWTLGVVFTAIAQWFVVVVRGMPAASLHRFFERYIRYGVHLGSYVYLGANPYPPFDGRETDYPIGLDVPAPVPQNRLGAAFRGILLVPFALLDVTLVGVGGGPRFGGYSFYFSLFAVVGTASLLGWFVAVALARMPRGLRDLVLYCLAYTAQVEAYALFVTDRFPTAEPAIANAPPAEVAVPIFVAGDLRRSRLTVFFRLLLALPHFVWITLWGIVIAVASIANWFAALVTGQPAASLHRFVSRYVRYQLHVNAFVYLAANPFPGFVGEAGSYPIDVELPPVERQHRASILFRALLTVPALLVVSALANTVLVAAVLVWFYALVRGRTTPGLRNLEAAILRLTTETYAYLLLVSRRYPYLGLTIVGRAEPES